MADWLRRRSALLAEADAMADAEAQAADAGRAHEALRTMLATALGRPPGDPAPLGHLATEARARLDAHDARERAAHQLAERESELGAARQADAAATAVLEAWRTAWADATGAVGLAPGTGVPEARETVDNLKRRSAAAQSLRDALVRAGAKAAEAEAAERRLAGELSALASQAGGVPVDALATVAELSDLARQLEDAADGEDIDSFAGKAAAADSADLDAEAAALEANLTDLNHAGAEAAEQFFAARGRFESLGGHGEAAGHAAAASSLEAEVLGLAEEWLRLRVARAMLAAAVERHRQNHQGAVVGRAGELFARLTCGSFEGVSVDVGPDDKPVLVALRRGASPVGVEGLSEGTADQLYLALRLAALEERLDGGEPLPLVIDDLLVTFDDERARAVLGVLGELAGRTQVVVFTHHLHLVALAREVLGGKGLHLAPLPQR
jgi:uncharacterized protein YhaN